MQVKDVDPIRIQTPQGRFAGGDEIPATQSAHVRNVPVHWQTRLGGQNRTLARTGPGQCLSDDAFALAEAVNVRRIENIDSLVQRPLDDGNGLRFFRTASEHHRAKA